MSFPSRLRRSFAGASMTVLLIAGLRAETPIQLANQPSLSPDGAQLAFAWRGDLWITDSHGGEAQRLTTNAANDADPHFSPDGNQLAFVSDRNGTPQVFLMPTAGGDARQVTWHSEGYAIEDWYPDGTALLVSGSRDHFWRNSRRLFRVSLDERSPDELLFDAYAADASLSPDGNRILFTREGERWWRQGYRGSRSAQVWIYNIRQQSFRKVVQRGFDCRWPVWNADGNSFYYTQGDPNGFDLWHFDLKPGEAPSAERAERITRNTNDSVVYPTISRDGSTLVFRSRFDLYRLDLNATPLTPEKIELRVQIDDTARDEQRRILESASEVAFTKDAKQLVFIAGGDVWVMDTKLKEPVRVTDSAEEEHSPVFSNDEKAIYYVSDADGQSDIWQATRGDESEFWWRNREFTTSKLTDDREQESDLQLDGQGEYLYFVRERGDLWRLHTVEKNAERIATGFLSPSYDLSPDGRWIAYSQADDNFNQEIWLLRSDGSNQPFNVSRHPDDETGPVFSPDGKLLAFTGRRSGTEVDIYYVWLQREQNDKSQRDRTLEEALSQKENERGDRRDSSDDEKDSQEEDAEQPPEMQIDFDGIHDRLRRISIADSTETGLFWSPDGKKLAFSGTYQGKSGLYSVEFPDALTPKSISTTPLSSPHWLNQGTITGLASGVPATLNAGDGSTTAYAFSARQTFSRSQRYRVAFDLCWRTMRDRWYDERVNNRNWDDVRRKYGDAAARAAGDAEFATIIHLMLGELNGSHLGFFRRGQGGAGDREGWTDTTAHLGVRFDSDYLGPGIRVRDVISDGPADRHSSRLSVGDVILKIDGVDVDPAMDLTPLLNGPLDRDIQLELEGPEPESTDETVDEDPENDDSAGENDEATEAPDESRTDESPENESSEAAEEEEQEEKPSEEETAEEEEKEQEAAEPGPRRVVIRPISFAAARSLLYAEWLEHNRQRVDELSGGSMGYLHIQAMSMPSFLEFERQLYNVGYGKKGLVIDVRENGGGSTADHLLTALTQPSHAITVPRGGGQGYPQSRRIYATWHKPIVVLCNQNSYSNAEIFSHAIKGLERGQLVGVPTAGGVISTGGVRILDTGFLRLPFRGWFVAGSGEDMELHGARPDHILWPRPGQLPAGIDVQLQKAVEVLSEDIQNWENHPRPDLQYASERPEATRQRGR